MRVFVLFFTLSLAACTDFPELAAARDSAALDAPFPELVPLNRLLAAAPQDTALQSAGPPSDRLAALRARAARLRAPVIDAATRARMARGVSHPF